VAGKIMSASDFRFAQTERVIRWALNYSFSRSRIDITVSAV
jgi:hypothetical protein